MDYYTDLDNEIEEILAKYVCEDDEVDLTNKENNHKNLPIDKAST